MLPEFPLFKIDVKNKVNKVLTEKEAKKLSGTKSSIKNQFAIFRTRVRMKHFPIQFKKRLLESANQIYKSTSKEKNVW